MVTPYGTADDFATYHESRGREVPAAWDDDFITAALVVASEWIDSVYGPSFIGYKTGGFTQEREWPRKTAVVQSSIPPYIFADDEMPDRLINATYEAAWRQGVTPGSLVKDYIPGKYKSVQIDGALTVEYRQYDNAYEIQLQISQVDTWLWPLLDCYSSALTSTLSGGSGRV